jgi:hypothetical protein
MGCGQTLNRAVLSLIKSYNSILDDRLSNTATKEICDCRMPRLNIEGHELFRNVLKEIDVEEYKAKLDSEEFRKRVRVELNKIAMIYLSSGGKICKK